MFSVLIPFQHVSTISRKVWSNGYDFNSGVPIDLYVPAVESHSVSRLCNCNELCIFELNGSGFWIIKQWGISSTMEIIQQTVYAHPKRPIYSGYKILTWYSITMHNISLHNISQHRKRFVNWKFMVVTASDMIYTYWILQETGANNG